MNRHLFAITGMVLLACLAAGALWVSGLAAQPPQEPDPERLRPDHYSFSDAALRPYLAASPDVPEALPAPSGPVDNWSKAAYEVYTDNWQIAIYDLDGSYHTIIAASNENDIHPHLSRGSGLVTFASRRNGSYDIFTVNTDNTGLTRLTSNGADEVYPTWSPDRTRILYQSYVNGNADIYVMYADGGVQTALTLDPDYDGMPSWSPDGTRITFISRRTGGYRVYTMNADGSNLLQINNQPYSADPHWSPDGSKILYDADSDGDGWQELWVMNANGSGQQLVEDASQSGSTTDVWAGGWAPDSIHISYTRVHFVYYYGQWYWDWGHILRGTTGGYEGLIVGGDTNWNADWQTEDTIPPVSAMNAAPVVSPYRMLLSWRAYDIGEAGVMDHDIQMRDGLSGDWVDCLTRTTATTGYCNGLGGHTYYFMVRSRDNSLNVEAWLGIAQASTWVENYPPTSRVLPLPAFSRDTIPVAWAGYDTGGSDPLKYDVQYRDVSGGGSWVNWLTNTDLTSQTFTGMPGTSYCFRSRAKDMAQNYEAWPAGDGDACTSFFEWMISGNAHETRGGTVISATASLAGGEVGSLPSNTDGYYAAYGAGETNYQVSWIKAGYLLLPAATFPPEEDARADIFLPPADNQVSNWGFENLLQDWQPAGALLPAAVPEARHSGAYGMLQGSTDIQFAPFNELADDSSHSRLEGFEVDGSGGLHLLWSKYTTPTQLFYAYRTPDGVWAANETVGTTEYYGFKPALIVTSDNVPHAVWAYAGVLYHSYRMSPATWSTPEVISGSYEVVGDMHAHLDPATGVFHVVWGCSMGSYAACYSQRRADGVWEAPIDVFDLPNGTYIRDTDLADGYLHIILANNEYFYYSRRDPDGSWLPIEQLAPDNGMESDLAVGSDGSVHFAYVFLDSGWRYQIHYQQRLESSGWGAHQILCTYCDAPDLAVGSDDVVHIIWRNGYVYYSWLSPQSGWSQPVSVYTYYALAKSIIVDNQNGVHILVGNSYTRRMANSSWSPLIQFRANRDTDLLAVSDQHSLSISYLEPSSDFTGSAVRFTSQLPAQATGLFSLSQALTVPVSLTNPTLSFLYQGGGYSPPGQGFFSVGVNDGVTQTLVYTTNQWTTDWTHIWADMSPWAGQMVTLTLGLNQAQGYAPAWAYLDEVTLGSAFPDVSTSLQAVPMSVLPGDQFTFQLGYANPAGVPAQGSVLTMTLPLGLDFIAASQPPAQAGSDLVWELGDLPGQSPMQTISVTVQVNAQAVIGSQLLTLARISTLTPELETANNTASSAIYVGRQVYLPVLRK